jgi:type II secretory pathway pseudopilin PulG
VGVVVAFAVLSIAAVLALYLLGTARRLDRLHARVDAAGAAFDAQLRRRSAVASSFADAVPLDPALAESLRDAAREAQAVAGLGHDREVVEHGVTRGLGWVVAKSPESLAAPSAAAAELHDEALRASFARSFYNDAIRDALVVRDRRIVRWLRLAGHAPHPAYFEMDDEELPVAKI